MTGPLTGRWAPVTRAAVLAAITEFDTLGGEPWAQECADPLQCGCDGFHCSACANTGLAKYQTIW